MAYIRFENINKFFGDLHVLKGINLDVEEGELVTLLGSSGCGKSTLLRCLAGLEEVQEGRIYLDNEDITHLDAKKRRIGMVFQQYSLFPNMTVRQNMEFGLKIKKLPKDEINKLVRETLDMVGLPDKDDAYPSQLSGGQQQRVALARAIVTRPRVLLLDEPLSAIDAKLRKTLQSEIRRIQKELSMTTIFVTHDQDEAMIMSDRICLMNKGRIEQTGSPIEIYTSPKTSFAASFIGNYNVIESGMFNRLSGESIAADKKIATRPETIALSRRKPGASNCIEFEGTVADRVTRGNVLRYTISTPGGDLYVDTLFRSFSMYGAGEKVWLSVERRNCLAVSDMDA